MEPHSLPRELESFYSYAAKNYDELAKKAQASDDAQEVFTSAAAHYVAGSDFTARIALRAAKAVRGE